MLIGRVVRLQVQRASLKVGLDLDRRYAPGPLLAVPELRVDPDGVVGVCADGASVLDVHNRRHPESRHRGGSGLSLGFTSHYRAMRERFGPHLVDGIAGENVLIEIDRPFRAAELELGVLRLVEVLPAEPCVPFARFALQSAVSEPADPAIGDALRFLRLGTRGYYATASGEGNIALGAQLCRRDASRA